MVPAALAVVGLRDVGFPQVPPGPVSTVATPLFFVGLSYPLLAARLAALRRAGRERAIYQRLKPLREAFLRVYPELELRPKGRALRPGLRYGRCVAECMDGLTRLRAAEPARRTEPGQETRARLVAAVALVDRQGRDDPADDPADAPADDPDAADPDVARLLQLAAALDAVDDRSRAA